MVGTRTVPIGYTLHNPHGVPIYLIELTRKCLRFRVVDERRWLLDVDTLAKTAVIRLTNGS